MINYRFSINVYEPKLLIVNRVLAETNWQIVMGGGGEAGILEHFVLRNTEWGPSLVFRTLYAQVEQLFYGQK